MTAMRVKRARRAAASAMVRRVQMVDATGDSRPANDNRIMGSVGPELEYVIPVEAIAVRQRSWPQRFIRSYLGWRKRLGIVLSLRAAWVISRAAPLPPVNPADPRSRPGRSWHGDAFWKHSEG
jgi:hypothetical protein